jgi:hypothetical protein
MPAKKKTTKSSAKKQQQPMTASVSSMIQLAPPCAGAGPHPGGVWSTFPYAPDGPQTYLAGTGFWGYVKRSPSVGGFVEQLGAEPGTGATYGFLYTGYRYDFTPFVAGDHFFSLALELGPVTRRPRYGKVTIYSVFRVFGFQPQFSDELPSNTTYTMGVRALLQGGKRYTLEFGIAINVENAGYQSYGEAILRSAAVKEFLPYGAQAPGLRAPEPPASFKTILETGRQQSQQQQARPISLEEAAAMGVGHI